MRSLPTIHANIQAVGRIIERVFRPCHVNYLLLGNIVPHLHVHIVPRYLNDSAPERPLPWNTSAVADDVFDDQLQRLQDAEQQLRHGGGAESDAGPGE